MARDVSYRHVNNARVVHDQLATQSVVSQIHENRRQLDERAFYPAHDARKESAEYAKVHKHLCIELDLPCMVCGVRHSTLSDSTKNRYGARAMETHHHVIEWALANAIDVQRFNNSLRPNLAHRHPGEPMYQHEMTEEEVRAWVDHSPHNLWVVCDVHHRHKFLGIHEISYPIWCPQDLLRPDFEEYVRKQLMGDGNDRPNTGGNDG
jgi:hypothetical protein